MCFSFRKELNSLLNSNPLLFLKVRVWEISCDGSYILRRSCSYQGMLGISSQITEDMTYSLVPVYLRFYV